MTFLASLRRSWWLLLIPLALLVCWFSAVRIVNSIDHRNNDFFTFWLAGHMLLTGQDPYASQEWVAGHEQFDVTWIPNQASPYPLPLAFFFAPLGLLPLYQAYILWVALSQAFILVSVLLLLPPGRSLKAWVLFLVFFAGVILFRPTTLTLVNGQVSAWLLLILVGVLALWRHGRWGWGACLLSLLALKPNLGAPLLLFLAAWLLFTRRYKALLALGLGALLLLLLGMVKNPAWLLEYWSIGNTKLSATFGFSPTLWGMASLACGYQAPCTLLAGGIAVALSSLLAFWILFRGRKKFSPLWVISLAVTFTLLITPYTWTYDQLLLLIPLAALSLSLSERRAGFIPAALLFPLIDLLCLILLVFNASRQMEILNAFIPLLVFGLLLCLPPRPLSSSPQ